MLHPVIGVVLFAADFTCFRNYPPSLDEFPVMSARSVQDSFFARDGQPTILAKRKDRLVGKVK
ncbi:hypothetical protein D3C87_1728170 [compost metagenome]